ncbi:uncharacterized protein BJ212DRAFT_1301651 [Suillus subaureus]|uniref:Uncharacterized protein n=1 Tax=Suillus subaureus TaxID=48587 RepID=A0A9P7JB58_9AGAM|nr:uncharacterized protein BJ212DRAFT_1301651 [Suillus subaureus]KAG1812122.1 hypothetical protein BJ212DRAFT_1301651 [Suillus subaureus]
MQLCSITFHPYIDLTLHLINSSMKISALKTSANKHLQIPSFEMKGRRRSTHSPISFSREWILAPCQSPQKGRYFSTTFIDSMNTYTNGATSPLRTSAKLSAPFEHTGSVRSPPPSLPHPPYSAEAFPFDVRDVGMSFATATAWFWDC